jgi:HK97 family phage prohead protease
MYDCFGPYVEVVSSGAFKKTLAQVDLDVPLVLNHDSLRRIADTVTGTLTLEETTAGLEADAPKLDPADADVAYIVPKLRAGLIREMSFKFRITKGSWSPDWMEYHIDEVDLHRGDVAIVGYGANPNTATELRSAGDGTVDLRTRSDAFVRDEFRRLRAELRSRGLALPMSSKTSDLSTPHHPDAHAWVALARAHACLSPTGSGGPSPQSSTTRSRRP